MASKTRPYAFSICAVGFLAKCGEAGSVSAGAAGVKGLGGSGFRFVIYIYMIMSG